MFIGEESRGGRCPDCGGRKVDRRNRRRLCPTCKGDGMRALCRHCGDAEPCSGKSQPLAVCTNPPLWKGLIVD